MFSIGIGYFSVSETRDSNAAECIIEAPRSPDFSPEPQPFSASRGQSTMIDSYSV